MGGVCERREREKEGMVRKDDMGVFFGVVR